MGNIRIALFVILLCALSGCATGGKRHVANRYGFNPETSDQWLADSEAQALAEQRARRQEKFRQMREDAFWRTVDVSIDIGFKVGSMLIVQAMDTDGILAPHEQAEALAVGAGMDFAGQQFKRSLAKIRE